MQSLKEIFETHSDRLLNKWMHYIDVYEDFFSKYRNKNITILEIGIAHGGSLQIWRKYFGPDVKIIGVDINPECKTFEEVNTSVFIGSQEDEEFLKQLKTKIPKVDILIEDGGHTMKQQITTFKMLFDHVKDGGLYICEDTHTSYWKSYHGGYKKKTSFIEFAKNFIDDIHGWHFKTNSKPHINENTKTIRGIHFYDSMVIVEKQSMQPPQNTFKGNETLHYHFTDYGQKKSFFKKIKNLFGKKK
jgi:23S rRNA U2552 (ribose-2'-O)-methylase RlmE/FtsJ